jgi:hypothetical protein
MAGVYAMPLHGTYDIVIFLYLYMIRKLVAMHGNMQY